MNNKKVFNSLNGIRGICGLFILLSHFRLSSHTYFWTMVSKPGYFVDLIFIIGGFVITAAYYEKLKQGFPATKFLMLRMARLYPVHLFVLGLYIILEISQGLLSPNYHSFTDPEYSIKSIFTIFFLYKP